MAISLLSSRLSPHYSPPARIPKVADEYSTSLLTSEEVRRLVYTMNWGKHLQNTLNHDFEAPSRAYEQAIHRGVTEGRDARHFIWLSNRGLVKHYVGRVQFRSAVVDTETLVQFGEIGLGIAIDKFDPDYGTKFSTYAMGWIRAMVLRCVGSLRDISFPTNINFVASKVDDGITEAEYNQLCNQYGIGKNQRKSLRQLFEAEVIHFETVADEEMGDYTYHDYIAETECTTEQIAIFNLTVERIKQVYERSSLNYTNRRVVYMRLGFESSDGHLPSFTQIAARTGYTRERARQVFNHAINYIRSDMKILAIDPGGTTGYILFEPETHTVLERGELKLFDRLDDLIDIADFVVYESFQLFSHKAKEQAGSEMPACEVIGVIKYLLKKSGKDFVTQKPSDQQLFDDQKLARMKLKSKSPHINSATKHLLYYLWRCKDEWIHAQLKKLVA